MKTLTTSILIAALTLTLGFAAQARSSGYNAASEYMGSSHAERRGHGKKSKHKKKKTASLNKQKRDVASVKKKSKKKKSKKSRKHHY